MPPESQPKCHSSFERQPPLETPVLRGRQQGASEKTADVRSETARAWLGVFSGEAFHGVSPRVGLGAYPC